MMFIKLKVLDVEKVGAVEDAEEFNAIEGTTVYVRPCNIERVATIFVLDDADVRVGLTAIQVNDEGPEVLLVREEAAHLVARINATIPTLRIGT